MSQVLPALIRREIVYSIHKSNRLSKKIGDFNLDEKRNSETKRRM